MAPLRHGDVGRLDVPVHDARLVSRVERVGHLDRVVEEPIGGHGAAPDHVLEGFPLHHLHHDEGLPFVLPDVVDRADPGVVQARRQARLALEALESGCVGGEPLGKELEGDLATEVAVGGGVDDSHPAASELLQDPIVTDRLAAHSAECT